MKAADLARATALIAEMQAARKLADRLGAGEPLRLIVGTGGEEAEIVLSAGFTAELRDQLFDALEEKALAARDGAIALGVEP